MMHYMYLASIFSMDGLRDFNQRCGATESLQECLRRLQSSPLLIRNDILNMQLEKDGTTYQFNKPLRYIEANYDIILLNVKDGVPQLPSVSEGRNAPSFVKFVYHQKIWSVKFPVWKKWGGGGYL